MRLAISLHSDFDCLCRRIVEPTIQIRFARRSSPARVARRLAGRCSAERPPLPAIIGSAHLFPLQANSPPAHVARPRTQFPSVPPRRRLPPLDAAASLPPRCAADLRHDAAGLVHRRVHVFNGGCGGLPRRRLPPPGGCGGLPRRRLPPSAIVALHRPPYLAALAHAPSPPVTEAETAAFNAHCLTPVIMVMMVINFRGDDGD